MSDIIFLNQILTIIIVNSIFFLIIFFFNIARKFVFVNMEDFGIKGGTIFYVDDIDNEGKIIIIFKK
jgi:hypothetical protein